MAIIHGLIFSQLPSVMGIAANGSMTTAKFKADITLKTSL